jgi:hypothetical protein
VFLCMVILLVILVYCRRYLSFRLQRELLDSEGVKLFEKKEETLPSPLQQFRGRQPLFDPVAPVDMPRDIAVGHKRPVWARQTLQEAEGHATPQGTSERARDQRDFRATFQP